MAVADRGQLLEVPIAMLDDPRVDARAAVTVHSLGARRDAIAPPLVVDLSAMWAGPLCAHLLGLAGARGDLTAPAPAIGASSSGCTRATSRWCSTSMLPRGAPRCIACSTGPTS